MRILRFLVILSAGWMLTGCNTLDNSTAGSNSGGRTYQLGGEPSNMQTNTKGITTRASQAAGNSNNAGGGRGIQSAGGR